MRFDLEHLPTDPALLHPLVRDMASVVAQHEAQIERLQLIIKQLQRAQFGRRSEQLNDDQLALGLEEIDIDQADKLTCWIDHRKSQEAVQHEELAGFQHGSIVRQLDHFFDHQVFQASLRVS